MDTERLASRCVRARARATVNVDFNLEEAWPEEIDRQQFYYLERETRKLEEIAWSDDVLQVVTDANGLDVAVLRFVNEVIKLVNPTRHTAGYVG